MALLTVKNLCIAFGSRAPHVVDNVSFEVERGEILALVGESGCGKSISCLALTSLLPTPPARVSADAILFREGAEEIDLARVSARRLRKVRGGGIAYIFQEPSVSLNPVFRIGSQIAEVLELHRPEVTDRRAEVVELLKLVGIPAPETRVDAYPHELSGGMQQRVMIAMALAGNPKLLIADEPTTALDVTIQAQILELIDDLRRKRDMAVILVTHNLGIVAEKADRVAVMYAGNIVEYAATGQLLKHPSHPYTRALLKAVPHLGGDGKRLSTIPGHVPSADDFAPGCRFSDRCERFETLSEAEREQCRNCIPGRTEPENGHFVRCFHPFPAERDALG
ncbi:ABC transporter ATP-binding protein [Victivallaceae bacterium BBE-744-WT-12]|uniref:ABC transporter ATP-binding protein n=1 Tax=Victivallis lenta TaxID=2606640 RepID=A0A844G6I5_9BACT|nr:ABC transporter ATP-binding protein [Victivallis lenta]AVM43233.1 ABC transporter ATP-binding protein [Victivallales bacterium CCUG 44730]MST98502.1 ABC transporter ATP-binding protein [Victivallis lenta]HBP07689.1 ABC transporter ATP-binding protein [Lentisphaeria bacterium]HCH86193.1 ABC transporter ATP-binding protein [Lentisphaeria bacterium]